MGGGLQTSLNMGRYGPKKSRQLDNFGVGYCRVGDVGDVTSPYFDLSSGVI